MATRNEKKGLIALLGLAVGGAIAWWKYNTATPEEKEKIKKAINDAGSKMKKTYEDVEDTVTDNYKKLKKDVKSEIKDVKAEI